MTGDCSKKQAFTLIELLVVIAIIALLVSILLPSLNQAKGLAKSAACSSNMHQLGIALGYYTSENQDIYPPHWGNGPVKWPDNSYGMLWYGFIALNMEWDGNTQGCTMSKAFYCPADEDANPTATYESLVVNVQKQSYGYNYNNFSSQWNRPVKTADVRRPQEVFVIADSESTQAASVIADYIVYPDIGQGYNVSQIHNGGPNLLFADTHVGHESFDDLHINTNYLRFWQTN